MKIRTAVRHWARRRLSRRRLTVEIATFRTHAERAELDAMIAHQPAEQTRAVRDALRRLDSGRPAVR